MFKKIQGEQNQFLRKGLLTVGGQLLVYFYFGPSSIELQLLFGIITLITVIVAIGGDPTRWSPKTTLRIYQTLPILFVVMCVAGGTRSLLVNDELVIGSLFFGWGIVSLFGVFIADWNTIETHLHRLNDPENDYDGPLFPAPRRQFQRARYRTIGLLYVTFAVYIGNILIQPGVGVYIALGGFGAAGLLHMTCSPYSGSPDRIVRLRRVRWAVLAAGTGASSLHGLFVIDAPVTATVMGLVTVAIGYHAFVRTSWTDVHDSIATAQTESTEVSG